MVCINHLLPIHGNPFIDKNVKIGLTIFDIMIKLVCTSKHLNCKIFEMLIIVREN